MSSGSDRWYWANRNHRASRSGRRPPYYVRLSVVAWFALAFAVGCSEHAGPADPDTPPVVGSVIVSPSSLDFSSPGETARLVITVLDGIGREYVGATVTWSSSDGEVASADAGGSVTALRDGRATISATAGGATATVPVTVADARAANRDALVALYNATGGPYWIKNEGWNSAAPLKDWHGVNVNSAGEVIALDLAENHLAGPIPSEIGQLTSLRLLDLASNKLRRSIPPEIGNLANLEWLSLRNNRLAGAIPGEIGRLGNLLALALGENRLTGSIPSEIGALDLLGFLELTRLELSGTIPPEIGNMTNLRYLFLSGTQIQGTIPSEIGNLGYLELMDLSLNDLTGNLPPEISNLAYLDTLDLSSNELSGSIPSGIGELDYLAWMDLSSNDLTGHLPPEFWNLSYLEHMNLSFNSFSGSIPNEIRNLTHLRNGNLVSNEFSGPIPLTAIAQMLQESRTPLFYIVGSPHYDFDLYLNYNPNLCLRQEELDDPWLEDIYFWHIEPMHFSMDRCASPNAARVSDGRTVAISPTSAVRAGAVGAGSGVGMVESSDLIATARYLVSEFGDPGFRSKLRLPPSRDQLR